MVWGESENGLQMSSSDRKHTQWNFPATLKVGRGNGREPSEKLMSSFTTCSTRPHLLHTHSRAPARAHWSISRENFADPLRWRGRRTPGPPKGHFEYFRYLTGFPTRPRPRYRRLTKVRSGAPSAPLSRAGHRVWYR